LGDDWEIAPAGGQTGEAYIARSGKRKLFLKRNSSPFLAVLSAEGIVPRLLWTKRLENGDVITAQHWLNGRELKANEMKSEAVAQLLRRIHRSEALLAMLKRLGKKALTPNVILEKTSEQIKTASFQKRAAEEALSFLRETVGQVQFAPRVVCHGDVNHNNWLLDEDGNLYLIDWDNAIVADPVLDVGALLYEYVEKSGWRKWLERYGLEINAELQLRMHWYTTAQVVLFMLWHRERGERKEAERLNQRLLRLNREGVLLRK
jgi:thiamine kinase-like enzyme